MNIHRLLEGISYTTSSEFDKNLSVIPVRDSRDVDEQAVFFAIEGVQADGHNYAEGALASGAAAVVVQRDLGLPRQIVVESTLSAYSLACANYFDNPADELSLIGITGTNGKTTVSYQTAQILRAAGHKVGIIGSIQNEIDRMILPSGYSTPDPFQLHSLLARMVQAGCEFAVMEVTSHGLAQKRVEGCHFAAAAFTNLTQDHLDYHGTMEQYFAEKAKLFPMSDINVYNIDDAHGCQLLAGDPAGVSFSLKEKNATLYASDISFTQQGSEFSVTYGERTLPAIIGEPGYFSVANALTAVGLCMAVGMPFSAAIENLSKTDSVPGRFERIPAQAPFTVIRDFAHSADGLENLLSTCKDFATGRIITVFGCAGQRDRTKRPLMAEAVARYSDYGILTSDNPRGESEQQIVEDTLPGFAGAQMPYEVIPDRLEAIRKAFALCQPGDLLVLAGKGHEDYQVLHYGTVYFNEREIVLSLAEKAD